MRRELLETVRDQMILTGSHRRLPKTERAGLIRIHRGAYLPVEVITSLRKPWDRRDAVIAARTIAALRAKPGCRPFGRTAASLAGFSAMGEDPTIHLHVPGGSTASPHAIAFAEISCNGMFVAPSTTTVHHRDRILIPSEPAFEPLDREGIVGVLLQCLVAAPGEESFGFACQVLKFLIGSDAGRGSGWRRRERAVRKILLDEIERLPPGTRNRRRARWIVENASGACESVAEMRLLWILRSAGIRGIDVQIEVADTYVHYFIDFGFPDLRIAIEMDGRVKYGLTAQEQLHALGAQEARQRDLEIRGWHFIRFTWDDLSDPQSILSRIDTVVRSRGGAIHRGARFPQSA
ncbi:endonuclease domain-containing protein [Actinomyces culturomici]|uniref:endonuclease domain-containing protein n=1 Tax=Actinomyces culturomici TaxID=1926276 RepID=UPI000E201FC7|nr:DUF559 domain-containing protein [Actinomyces culturomici]